MDKKLEALIRELMGIAYPRTLEPTDDGGQHLKPWTKVPEKLAAPTLSTHGFDVCGKNAGTWFFHAYERNGDIYFGIAIVNEDGNHWSNDGGMISPAHQEEASILFWQIIDKITAPAA